LKQFILIDPSIAEQIDEKKDSRKFRPFSYDNLMSSSDDDHSIQRKKGTTKLISVRESDDEFSTENLINEYNRVHHTSTPTKKKSSSMFKPKKINEKKKRMIID
jgi:rhodanese-related sulfurtransferase